MVATKTSLLSRSSSPKIRSTHHPELLQRVFLHWNSPTQYFCVVNTQQNRVRLGDVPLNDSTEYLSYPVSGVK